MAAFGANFGLQGLAPAMGSELLGTLLAGKLADEYKVDGNVTITQARAPRPPAVP